MMTLKKKRNKPLKPKVGKR